MVEVKLRWMRCNCCGIEFQSRKPQDPERDTGYGSCELCFADLVFDRIMHDFETLEQAVQHLMRYA
jgi:hypothetical protein